MKRVLIFAVALAALRVAPASALVNSAPVPAEGITPAEVAQLLAQHEMSPKLSQSSDGQSIINGRVAGVGFDVRFDACNGDHCRDVKFQAGWSNAKGDAKLTPERLNDWNRTYPFLRAYVSADNTLWAEMDARIARGSTANVEEYIVLWPTLLRQFKPFMGL